MCWIGCRVAAAAVHGPAWLWPQGPLGLSEWCSWSVLPCLHLLLPLLLVILKGTVKRRTKTHKDCPHGMHESINN
jgi:hypothetical protein